MKRGRDCVPGGIDKQRVAVGVGLRYGGGPDRESRTGPVLYDDGLAKLDRQLLEHDARNDVGDASSSDWHDRLQRFRRPRLSLSVDARENERKRGQRN